MKSKIKSTIKKIKNAQTARVRITSKVINTPEVKSIKPIRNPPLEAVFSPISSAASPEVIAAPIAWVSLLKIQSEKVKNEITM
jgi:hypothetical protein